jgi:hypothetical protein
MTITVTGDVTVEDIKDIVREHYNELWLGGITVFIPYKSFHALYDHEEVKRAFIYMLPSDTLDGKLTLYGASIQGYFTEGVFEEAN